jgi:hypothetical protein
MLIAFITCTVLPPVGVVALVREVHLRRALQRLFARLLSHWSNLEARKSAWRNAGWFCAQSRRWRSEPAVAPQNDRLSFLAGARTVKPTKMLKWPCE